MREINLEEAKALSRKSLLSCRTQERNEHYGESLDFYLKNDFFFEECWNLDITLSALILPRLIYFKDITSTIPNNIYELYEGQEEEAMLAWKEILNKIIWAFYIILHEEWGTWPNDEMNEQEREAQVKEGLRLFTKYFENLWD